MAGMGIWDSSSISTLFSSMNSGRSSFGNAMIGSIDLGTYKSIKSGSYSKLLKSYYNTDAGKASLKSAVNSTNTSKDSAKTLSSIKSATDSFTKEAADLYKGNSTLFKKDSNGEYNTSGILSAVKEFVSGYNDVIEASEKSNTANIASASSSLISSTNFSAKLLSSVGITIDSKDFTLSLDEEKFKSADMSTVKSLFNGYGSFGYQAASKAAMIGSYASIESSKSNTYNGKGSYTYNYQTGEVYSGSF